MRFVPVKSEQQQAVLVVHRLRAATVVEHTRTINQMRGLLAEFGIIAAQGAAAFKERWLKLRLDQADCLPPLAWQTLDAWYEQLLALHQKVLAFDRQIKQFVREDVRAARLAQVKGIGPLTASALVATVGNGRDFNNGRQFAAWLVLTPRQYSTGGKPRLGHISKRGNVYRRTLLVHGARSELNFTAKRDDRKSRWAEGLKHSKSWNKAAVALANKHARIAWALLANDQPYQPA
jgi:transposase